MPREVLSDGRIFPIQRASSRSMWPWGKWIRWTFSPGETPSLPGYIDLDDGTASLNLALEVAEYFALNAEQAREIAKEVGQAVADWRQEAARLELTAAQIDRMESAFEHDDLRSVLAL